MTARPLLAPILAAAFCALPATAQQLELPRPSPNAKVSQMVGVTDVALEYSSPGVKGRNVFADVAPVGKLWRAGANSATKITFSKDVQIGSTKVPAGSYSIFAIPGREQWTWIVNKNPTAQANQYKEADDAVRATVKPEQIPARERLAFLFSDTTEDGTRLDLEWADLRASLPIRAFTADQVKANIQQLETGLWQMPNSAARYLFESKKDPQTALRLVDRSIALQEHWYNVWTKAELLHAAGKQGEAHKLAERAQELGAKAGQGFFFADEVKKAVTDWK